MGDMADMALEQMCHDSDFYEEQCYGIHVCGGGRQPHCKYCGSTKVGWRVDEANRWRLINLADSQPHTCKEYYDKHRPRAHYIGREIVLTEPLPEPNRKPYVPYLDWTTSVVRQRDVEVAQRTSRESRFAYNGHAW